MSQSDKADPKTKKSKGKDKSDPVSEGPSAETTEEVISAVNQYFGIGQDHSTTTLIEKKTGKEDEKVDDKASSLKNLQQPTPVNIREDSDLRVRPEASKVSTSKAPQSQTNIRSVRDLNAGRILTRSNSEKLFEQKQQGSGNVSLDPTESVISAVTQYFGIGQDDKPTKKTTNVPRDQIVAASQQVMDNHDSSNDTKKQTSSSKVTSPITAKQKSSPETSSKSDSVSVELKPPPESIGKQSQPIEPEAKSSNDSPYHARKQTSSSTVADPKVTPTAPLTEPKSRPETSTKSDNVIGEPRSSPETIMKQSQPVVDKTTVDRSNVQRLTETGEPSSKRVTIVPTAGPTPSESVVTAVTDFFGISHSVQSASVSKINVAPQETTTSTRKQSIDTGSSIKDPLKQVDANVASTTKSDPVKKSPLVSPVLKNEEETNQMIENDQIASSAAESKETPRPEVLVAPVPAAVTPQDKSKKINISLTSAQPLGKKYESIESIGQAAQSHQPQSAPANESNTTGIQVTPTSFSSKAPDYRVVSTSANTPVPTAESTPSESVVTAVTDFFGISQSVKSSSVSKINGAPQQTTTSTSKQSIDTRSNIKDPLKHDVANVASTTKSVPVEKSLPASPVFENNEETNKITGNDQIASGATGSKETSPPEVIVAPVPATVTSQDNKDKETPITSTSAQPSGKKSKSIESPVSPAVQTHQRQFASANETDITTIQVTPTSLSSKAGDSTVLPISATSGKNTQSVAQTLSTPLAVHSSGVQGPKVLPTPPPPQNAGASRVEMERTIDDHGQPDAAKTVDSSVSPSPTNFATPTPDVGIKQDFKRARVSEMSSKTPPTVSMAEHPGIIATDKADSLRTMDENPDVPTSKTETSRKLNNQKTAESTMIDSSSPASQASVNIGGVTGQSQPIAVVSSGWPQPVGASMTETPRTLNEQTISEPTTTSLNVTASPPAIIKNIPPVVNAQDTDTGKNKGRSSQESSKAADLKTQTVPAGISQKPQPVTPNVAETSQTIEGQRTLGTTSSGPSKPAVSAEAEVSITPQPAAVNSQDPRPNKSATNAPPSPAQSTTPFAGVSNTGSSALTGVPSPVRTSYTSTSAARQCWICFATDEDELGLHWIQPCKCKGTTKWVHQSCLQMWIDEKLREHKEKKVTCPQCRTEYLIYLPQANILVKSLDQVDNVIFRVCPFVAAGVVIGCFYWNAVTYGAIVMLQVAGSEGAAIVAETFRPTVIIVGLPFIPLSLILFRLFQWEDSFLYLLRITSHCLPPLQYILPGHVVNETGVVPDEQATTAMSFQRVLAGALFTPVIAKVCGNMFLPSVESPVWRTVFGGALFVGFKGLIKMYHKQQIYKRLSRRKILDYTDENKILIEQARPVMISQVTPTPLRFQFVASVESRRARSQYGH